MNEKKNDKGKRKSKLQILETMREFFIQAETVVFNRSAMRHEPWNIDPRTAAEFFRIIQFCQTKMPPVQIIEDEDGSKFLAKVHIPPVVLTIKEAKKKSLLFNKQLELRNLKTNLWNVYSQTNDDRKVINATESFPKLENTRSYWENSKVQSHFKCSKCNTIEPYPWHCIEPMDINEEHKLQCYRCNHIEEIPKCSKCGNKMKLEFVDNFGKRLLDKKT